MLVAQFIQSIDQQLPIFVLIQTRIASLFTSLFFLRREVVPSRILIGLSLVLTIFVMSTGRFTINPDVIGVVGMFMALLMQTVLGLITGITINFFVELFLGLGQLASMQSGLGFVNFYVARIGTVTPMTQFFMILATLIFFELNGHLILIELVINSLRVTLTPTNVFNGSAIQEMLLFAKIIFSGSFLLALAATISIMLSSITNGLVSKFAPQVNILSLGINMTLIVCYFAIYISFDLIVEQGRTFLTDILSVARRMQP